MGQFVTETAIEEDWRQNVRMIRRSLYKLANEMRLNRIRVGYLWKGNFELNYYTDTCGRGNF